VVVDDNEDNIVLLQRILRLRPQLEVLVETDGLRALELIQHSAPSLVLLDLNLPSMSGEEILLAIQSSAATVGLPVVVLSGDATASADRRAREAGAVEFLRKPFEIDGLLAAVDKYLAVDRPQRS
jgi:CheY-like chemotaxis protein